MDFFQFSVFLLDDRVSLLPPFWAFDLVEQPGLGHGVPSVGAQSRAAALFKSSCLFQVKKPENLVIESPTVKLKEGGLLVRARPSHGVVA